VFLNTKEFAELATHYKAGSTVDTEPVPVIATRDNETNSGMGYGDAALIDEPARGSEIKRAIRLQMPASVVVTEQGKGTGTRVSVFKLADGTYCTAVRVVDRDEQLQTVLCLEVDRRSQQRLN
jgi:hypothetical protein